MKAQVKSTGEIVDVVLLDECIRGILMYKSTEGDIYTKDSLEFDYYNKPDYWTRLEHQAAIAAMQGIVMNTQMQIDLHKAFGKNESMEVIISELATDIAHALVEKYKEKEERK